MRRIRIVWLVLCGAFSGAAGTIEFTYSGNVTSVVGSIGAIAPDDPVTGHFSYDPGQAPLARNLNAANYVFNASNTLDLTIGRLTFVVDPSAGQFFAAVTDDGLFPPFPGFVDAFDLLGQLTAGTWPAGLLFPVPGGAGLEITEIAGSATLPVGLFTGTNLPLSLDPANALLTGELSNSGIGPGGGPSFNAVFFSVDQVTATPEPSTAATLAFCLLAGALTLRRG